MCKMKRNIYVLITGSNSFVGNAVKSYLTEEYDNYVVHTAGMRNGEWVNLDFSIYDVVFHVAGLAHSDTGFVSKGKRELYYKVNTDLTEAVATKAKKSKVKQFIFMSSAIVYGDSAPIGKSKVITRDSLCCPVNFYGDSKVQAEKKILALADKNFKVLILRCPMIYGKGAKGNFPVLESMALKLPFFPKVDNRRSMLYIGNFVEFIRLAIENEEFGMFWPCNKEFSNTSEIVRLIANVRGKHILLLPGLTWLLKIMSYFTDDVNKAFGNFVYDESLGEYKEEYRVYTLEESIKETEIS